MNKCKICLNMIKFMNKENITYAIYILNDNMNTHISNPDYFPKVAPKYWEQFFKKCNYNNIFEDNNIDIEGPSLYVFPIMKNEELVGYLVTLKLYDDHKVSYIKGALQMNSLD